MQSVGLFLIILAILIIGLCMICSVQIISQQKRIEPAEECVYIYLAPICSASSPLFHVK